MARLHRKLALLACTVHSTIAGPLQPRYGNTTLAQGRITPASLSSVTLIFVGGSSSAIFPIAAKPTTIAQGTPENAAIAYQETSRSRAESDESSASATRYQTGETSSTTSIHFSYSPQQSFSDSASAAAPCTREPVSVSLVTSMVTLYTTIYPSLGATVPESEVASSSTAQVSEISDQTRTATVTLYTTFFSLQGNESESSTIARSEAEEGRATETANASASSNDVSKVSSSLQAGNLGEISSLLFSYSPQLETTTAIASRLATGTVSGTTVAFSYAPPGSVSSKTSQEPTPTKVMTKSENSDSALAFETSTQVIVHPHEKASKSTLSTSERISTSQPAGITIVPVNPGVSIVTVTKTVQGTKQTETVTETFTVTAKL